MALRKLKPTRAVAADGKPLRMIPSEWEDPDLLGMMLFECIEDLESLGMLSKIEEGDAEYATCMDYLLDYPSTRGQARKLIKVTIKPDSYNGSNIDLKMKLGKYSNLLFATLNYGSTDYKQWYAMWEKEHVGHETIEDFVFRKNGALADISIALSEFYIKNPMAKPESEHCSVYQEGGADKTPRKTLVNCLTKIFELDRNNQKLMGGANSISYYDKSPYLDIINSGARCGMFTIRDNGYDKYLKTSCLESMMELDVKHSQDTGDEHIREYGFGANIDKFDMSLDCINTVDDSGGTIPCMQKLTQGNLQRYKNFVMLYKYSQEHINDNFMRSLLKKYEFKLTNPDDVPESSAIDYMINRGSGIKDVLSTEMGVMAFDEAACMAPDKTTSVNCLSKLLVNLTKVNKGDAYYAAEDLDWIIRNITESSIFRRHIMESACYDGTTSIPCMGVIIDLASLHDDFRDVITRIATTNPFTDFICAEKRGSEYKTTNCLDKLIGVSNRNLMRVVLDTGMLIDRKDCTDWDGTPITCIDKLFQRHEMWVHNYFRARELTKLRFYYNEPTSSDRIRVENNASNLKRLSEELNIDKDPGFRRLSGQYDIGSLKVHQPSKMFEAFKPVLDAQLVDYMVDYTKLDDKHKPPINPTREAIRYTQDLVRSITSDRLSKETQMVPKIFKMVDVYSNMMHNYDDYACTGAESILSNEGDRKTPVTLNMFECKDVATDKTISCLQKQIDAVKYTSERFHTSSDVSVHVGGVMALKDIFKPEMCTNMETGDKITCLEYAYNNLSDYMSDWSYVALISRKDFSKVADLEINTDRGKQKLSDVVCKRATINSISNYLESSRASHSVTNGHPTFDGSAMNLIEKCKCANRKTPLDRRICMDTLCFNSYIDEASAWTSGYLGDGITETGVRNAMYPQIYHDSRDYFGASGVYDVTYKPSEYRITDNERFDYGTAVREVLYPAIKRVKGMKLARLGDKKNVVITSVSLVTPSEPQDDYIIDVVYIDENDKTWLEHYPAAQIFIRGGLLNREDMRTRVIRYKNENDTVEKILTRGAGKPSTEAKLKLVVSNRPSDFMRASTCQDWRSCMNLEDGCYNGMLPFVAGMGGYMAYLASDEFSPSWYARTQLLPVMRYKEGDPKKDENEDPNNTIRINDVYGLSMYKPLLKDAIRVVLRGHGYNEPGSFKSGNSDDFIMDGHNVKLIKEDIWMNCRMEAYRNCLERVISGENVSLPNGKIASVEDDCEYLKLTLKRGGARISDMYNSGLISRVTFDRFTIIDNWQSDYIDSSGVDMVTLDSTLNDIKKKVNVNYSHPITIPEDLPHGVLKGAAV